jgi:hypothetical protein
MTLQGEGSSVPFPITLTKSGNIGFQLEGGVITVTAVDDNINVSFDRPMVYGGSHTHVPGGTPYDIGTPALAPDARSIDVPITVPASPAPEVTSIVATDAELVVNFSSPVTVNGTVVNNGLVLVFGPMSGAVNQLSITVPISFVHLPPGENMHYVCEFGAAATGLTPVFDTFIRLDTGGAATPQTGFTEIGTTGSFYFDQAFLSTDPDIYFQVSCAGVQVTAIKARTDFLPVDTSSILTTITKQLTRALGLLHENAVLDQTTYESGTNNLLSGRIRVYNSEANAVNARNQSELNNEYDVGKLAQYSIVGHYLGDNMVNYLTTKVWEAP